MTRFDALAEPITTCFMEEPDLTAFRATPSKIPLDERNPAGRGVERGRGGVERGRG